VFVGSLPFRAGEAEIRAHFAAGGAAVTAVRLPVRKDGRRSGIGFVEFASEAQARAALAQHGSQLMGRSIHVRPAQPDAGAADLARARFGRVAVRPRGCRAVFVGNLAWGDAGAVRAHFAGCGPVAEVSLDHDRLSGEFKRSARVRFNTSAAVEAAVQVPRPFVHPPPSLPY